MDNAPCWDAPLRVAPTADHVHLARRDVATVAASLRPTDLDYRRYLGIVDALRAAGWDTERQAEVSPFAVEDVAFTAIAARGARDLVEVADDLGEDASALTVLAKDWRAALAQLWDDEVGWFRSFDVRAAASLGPLTATGVVALWGDGATPAQVDRMSSRLDAWSAAVSNQVVTCDPNADDFDPVRYWRGPVWVLVNWLVADGLARAGRDDRAASLRSSTAGLVEREGFSEYYDARTGAGIGGHEFSWSAALTLAWLTAP
jgi:neutral trehalase